MMNPISRRNLLGAAGVIAAAGATAAVLPPAVTNAAATSSRPSCPCNPPRPMMGVNRERMDAAWDVLMNAGPEVREAAAAFDAEMGNSWMAEFQLTVDAFAAHHPGFEAGIQLIADHVNNDSVTVRGCECFS